MSHTTNIPQLRATGTREELIAYCQWNDRNGVWSDDECAAEGIEPATIDELRAIIQAWTIDDSQPIPLHCKTISYTHTIKDTRP